MATETITLTSAGTVFVSGALPDLNLSVSPVLIVGTNPVFGESISFLQFPLPPLPVTSVDNATLRLFVIFKTGDDPSPIHVNRVTEDFDVNTVTYNTMPPFVATGSMINVATSNVGQYVEIDVTDLVNQWLAVPGSDHGIALTNPDGTTEVQFGDKEIGSAFEPQLVITYTTVVPDEDAYAYIFNTGNQSIPVDGDIPFNSNGALKGISHDVNTGSITIENPGTYAVWFSVTGGTPNQFALYQNDSPVPGSIYGTESASAGNIGMVIINAEAGDVLSVRNHTSTGPVALDNSAGGTEINTSASIKILRIGPPSSPDPALAAVNAAQDITEMRAAIEDPALGLDLTEYNALSPALQDQVLATILANRPTLGYQTVASVQDALNNAINQLVDPDNIYVKAGSVDGNGSKAKPFGTIPQGIAAVNPGGTVHVLAGTYPITSQINVNKPDITVLGEPGTLLLLQADLIPLLITGSGATLQGLTITSDIPYPKEFIQIGAPDVKLIGNTVYGPFQPPPMDTWVVNRAVVSQVATSNVLLEGNTFYSLRTGMYINPNTTGAINNNVVYNTKGGFLVDGAFTTFVGNSWGDPPNEFDIVLLPGTTFGPPYDDIPALQAANNNATISDQRV